ncbi:MAG: ribosomal protein S18-alanine N-acetyltransferase [Clostridia bacterium]|nr:ribosomal protein S18-alanine N-acetyltransferase [Clostridia bacterium]
MKIVPLDQTHLAQAAALEQRCFSDPWSAAGFAAELESGFAHDLAAVQGETLLGYLCAAEDGETLYISNLAVAPQARRQGTASALLNAACAGALARGCRTAVLEVRASNRPARALYAAHGFTEAGVRRGLYDDPPEDGVVCIKSLNQEDVI